MAIAHKILVAVFHMLAQNIPFPELGEGVLHQQGSQRTTTNPLPPLHKPRYDVLPPPKGAAWPAPHQPPPQPPPPPPPPPPQHPPTPPPPPTKAPPTPPPLPPPTPPPLIFGTDHQRAWRPPPGMKICLDIARVPGRTQSGRAIA